MFKHSPPLTLNLEHSPQVTISHCKITVIRNLSSVIEIFFFIIIIILLLSTSGVLNAADSVPAPRGLHL